MAISVLEFIKDYQLNERYYAIPEFQRTFKWKAHQIEDLFDSIFRRYPLPRFFVWTVERDSPVGLFKISTVFEKKEVESIPFREDEYQDGGHLAICDGQQRLTSIIIGMLGLNFSKSKKPRFLYFDVFFNSSTNNNLAEVNEDENVDLNSEEDNKRFLFKTASEAEAENNLHSDHYWIKVSEFFNFYKDNKRLPQQRLIDEFIRSKGIQNFATNEKNQSAFSNLITFLNALSAQTLDIQNLEPIIGDELKEAVEFFKRINGKGKPLSANEILFALISRHLGNERFSEINFREDLVKLTEKYCNKETGIFKKVINWDYYLRACLYLTNDEILFHIDSFNEEKCIRILECWPNIKTSIENTFNLIKRLEINHIIVSINSLIPIVYHFYKKDNNLLHEDEKKEIEKYLIRSQFSNVFGSHGDSLLSALKRNQKDKYENPDYRFSFNDLNTNLPPDKFFNVSEEKINDLINREYGDKIIKPILSLITEGANSNSTYQVDHIHPESICANEGQLMYQGVVGDTTFILENYHKLPNLQLLINTCNQQHLIFRLDKSNNRRVS
jgi:uncharacterized protein with ParB-like and HNH nuclease domain